MGKETEIQREVMGYLHSVGFLVWRNHMQGVRINGRRIRNPNVGQPDIWAVKNGRLLGVEVKTATGRLSDEQVAWIGVAQKYSVPIIVAHSVGELRETLAEIWEPYFKDLVR